MTAQASILQWNIRNYHRNKQHLSHLATISNIKIICLQETWQKPSSLLKLSRFNLISSKSHQTNKGGGVAIFASLYSPSTPLTLNSNLEVCGIKTEIDNKIYTIVSLYIPPQTTNIDIKTELKILYDQLSKPFIICSDINGHHSSWGSESDNHRGTIIDDWITNTDQTLINNGSPTYETAYGTYTHIDITTCSENLATKLDWQVHHDNYTSDHYPIFTKFKAPTEDVIIKTPRYNIIKADRPKFLSQLNLPSPPLR